MKKFHVSQSVLRGKTKIPPSKSQTLRAILFASLSTSTSHVRNYLHSPDTQAMIEACKSMGAGITATPDCLTIQGVSGLPFQPEKPINAGNSGQVLRFVGAIASLIDGKTILTGDESIQKNRPVKPLLEGLNQLGAKAESVYQNDHAPISVIGPIQPGKIKIHGEDSQPVSGLLIAMAFLENESEMEVIDAGEKPWVNLTLSWFDRLGIKYSHENFERYKMFGGAFYSGFDYTVPADLSSAAFPIVAALITGSEITLEQIDLADAQGDKKLLDVLEQMGATFEYDQEKQSLHVLPCKGLKGVKVDVNDFVDAVTILAVAACFAEGQTDITGASIAREKESNRLASITAELKKLGGNIQETDDGLLIEGAKLHRGEVESYHDHRMALSLAVAGCAIEGELIVNDAICATKTFPDFVSTMKQLNVTINS